MIAKLLILSISIFAIAKVLPGVKLKNFWTAVIVAVVYSIVSFFFNWLLVLLSMPFILITFGLFMFVINAFMLWVTDKVLEDFEIDNLKTTLLASVGITLVSTVLNWIF